MFMEYWSNVSIPYFVNFEIATLLVPCSCKASLCTLQQGITVVMYLLGVRTIKMPNMNRMRILGGNAEKVCVKHYYVITANY